MKNKKSTRYLDFETELLNKPGIRKEYDALKPKYDLVRTIIERRNQLQISQTHLARIVGTRQPAISRLEKGDSNTTLNTLFKVADALDLDIALMVRPTPSLRARRARQSAVGNGVNTGLPRRLAPL
jgi:transcriptional regulator with XRE-family HTH domain